MKLGAVLLALVAFVACANAMRLTYDANFFGGADQELAPSSALFASGLRGLSPNFVEENADMGARCGQQNGGASCNSLGAEYEGACCSKWGFCGRGKVHCAQEFGCQSNCESGDSPLLIEEQEKPKKKTKTVIKDVIKKVKSTKTQKKEIQVVIPGAPPEVPIPDVPPPTKVVPALEKEPFERMIRIIHSACPVCKKRPKPQPTTLEEISKEASEASGDDTPEEESSEETSEEASEEEEDDDEEKEPEPSVPEEAKIAKPTKEEKKIAKDLGLEPKKKGCKTTDLAAKRKELAAEYLAKLHHYEQHQKELAEEIRKASNNDALRAELQALTQQVGSLKAQAEKGWSAFTSGKSSSAPSEKKAEDKAEDKKEEATDSESSKKGTMEATGSAVKLSASAIANAQEENKRQAGRKTYSLSDNPEAVNNERDQQLHRS